MFQLRQGRMMLIFAEIEVYDMEKTPHILKVGWMLSNKPAI